MEDREYTCLLVSDFNIESFGRYLINSNQIPRVKVEIQQFGLSRDGTLDEESHSKASSYDFAIFWTQPQRVIPSFKDMLEYKVVHHDLIMKEVDEFTSMVKNTLERVKVALLPTWVVPSYHRGFGLLDLKKGIGISDALIHMNLRISENFSSIPNLYFLNTQKWIDCAGKDAFSPKLWYMGKIPFGNEVFRAAVMDIKGAMSTIHGRPRKLIVVDLDDTLWGGIVGETGWRDLRLGGHDHIGESYVDFQNALKALSNRGILLAIVSKNEESVALEAIENHPEMVLRKDDFVAWRINWQDKSQNIVDLVGELNLGLESVVFIDDSPIERARVHETLPEVLVPEWPKDKMLYTSRLLSMSCFDSVALTREDFERNTMYLTEQKRLALRKTIGSMEDWLSTLDIRVKVDSLTESNLQRAIQLLNKTNQMNLTTRRMTQTDLLHWLQDEAHMLWTFRVSDKFGDSGLTGLVSIEIKDKRGRIVDFVLSCRVFGRRIEEAMLFTVIEYARTRGMQEIFARYIPTPKNKPCLHFFKGSGFTTGDSKLFIFKLNTEFAKPSCIEIDFSDLVLNEQTHLS